MQRVYNLSADLCLSFQSKGAKEKIVTRIIVSRCEVDLKKICSEYKTNFGQSLQQTITVSFYISPLDCYSFMLKLVRSSALTSSASAGAHKGRLPEGSAQPVWTGAVKVNHTFSIKRASVSTARGIVCQTWKTILQFHSRRELYLSDT